MLEPDDGSVEREIELDAPVGAVWAALTEPSGLSAWLGGEVSELEVRPGGRGMVRRADGAERRIAVEAVEPMERLVFRWWPFAAAGSRLAIGSTRVEFRLEGRDGRTVLRVVERAPLLGGGAVASPMAVAR